MKGEKSKSGVVIVLHLLTWALLGFVLMFYQPLSWGVKLPFSFWIKQSLNIVLLAGLFYSNALVMVPSLLLKNKVPAFAVWAIGSVIFLLAVSKLMDHQLHLHEQMDAVMPRPGPRPKGNIDTILLLTSLLVLGISTSLAVILRWQTDAELHESVEKQNITSELALLKAQINPHFFFNTLNNIYALTYTDVPVSREAILKLSRMMRYLLYETGQDTAQLSQEISFVKDYVELMKLRMQSGITVSMQEPKPEKEYFIAPMLLLPFIENAFKHGISVIQKAEIMIDLHINNNILTLKVLNHIFHEKNALDINSGGIGLINTQRRLDLLYPKKHELFIQENKEENTYLVVLNIVLG